MVTGLVPALVPRWFQLGYRSGYRVGSGDLVPRWFQHWFQLGYRSGSSYLVQQHLKRVDMKAFYMPAPNRKLLRTELTNIINSNRDIIVGETHSVTGDIGYWENGLRGNKNLIDAMWGDFDNTIFLVELSGDIDESDESRIAGRNRKYIAEYDATELLREFSRIQAKINVEKIRPHCSASEYNTIVGFLESGDPEVAEEVAHIAKRIELSHGGFAYRFAACSVMYAAYSTGIIPESHQCSYIKHYLPSVAWDAARWASWCSEYANERTKEQHTFGNAMITDMLRERTGWDI